MLGETFAGFENVGTQMMTAFMSFTRLKSVEALSIPALSASAMDSEVMCLM
jgi:hypothetical protein